MYVKDKRIINFSTSQFYNIFMDHKNKNWDKEHFKKSNTNGYKFNCSSSMPMRSKAHIEN